MKTASDFIGQYVGQSQTKTNQILEQAQGKVLVIDEAYAFGTCRRRDEKPKLQFDSPNIPLVYFC